MTREEKIIATAFTGEMFIDNSDMGLLYEYMEKKVGHGVIDLMLANEDFWAELHKACRQDFIDMVSKDYPPLSSNVDEASEEFAIENCEERMGMLDLKGAFKAGAEWMAGQGETLYDYINVDGKNQRWLGENLLQGDYDAGQAVIVQIRKV